jgi:DNA-binding response OmpR family regulator
VNRCKVLVVDDNESNRIILSRCVRRAGYDAVSAEDGPQALEALANDAPDLVLLDWNMPNLAGIDLLRAIRASHSAEHLPVIMCTARTSSRDVQVALAAGANDFITKPIDIAVAIARIEAQLQRRQATRTLEAINGELEEAVAQRTKALFDANVGGKVDDQVAALEEILRLARWLEESPEAGDASLRAACAASISAAARSMMTAA